MQPSASISPTARWARSPQLGRRTAAGRDLGGWCPQTRPVDVSLRSPRSAGLSRRHIPHCSGTRQRRGECERDDRCIKTVGRHASPSERAGRERRVLGIQEPWCYQAFRVHGRDTVYLPNRRLPVRSLGPVREGRPRHHQRRRPIVASHHYHNPEKLTPRRRPQSIAIGEHASEALRTIDRLSSEPVPSALRRR